MQRITLAVYAFGVGSSQSLMSLGAALLCLWALYGLGQKSSENPRPRSEKIALILGVVYVLFMILNLLMRSPDSRTWHTLGHLPYFLIPLLALCPRRTPQPRWTQPDWIWATAAVVTALAGLVAIYQYGILGIPALGLMRNPIYFAYNIFPAFIFFAECAYRISASPRLKVGMITIAALAGIGVLLSENRMTWIGLALYLVWRIVPLLWARGGVRLLAGLSLIGLLLSVGLYHTQPRLQEKLQRTFSQNDPSRTWRFRAWEYNWSLFRQAPLLGTGAERNGIDIERQPEMAGHWHAGRIYFAHSVYLQSLADSGLIGSLLLLATLITYAYCFPATQFFLILMALTALTENIFNNSRAGHAFYLYLLLSALYLPSPLRKQGGRHGST